MIVGVYGFLWNVNKSSVNVFITTKNNSVAEDINTQFIVNSYIVNTQFMANSSDFQVHSNSNNNNNKEVLG